MICTPCGKPLIFVYERKSNNKITSDIFVLEWQLRLQRAPTTLIWLRYYKKNLLKFISESEVIGTLKKNTLCGKTFFKLDRTEMQ